VLSIRMKMTLVKLCLAQKALKEAEPKSNNKARCIPADYEVKTTFLPDGLADIHNRIQSSPRDCSQMHKEPHHIQRPPEHRHGGRYYTHIRMGKGKKRNQMNFDILQLHKVLLYLEAVAVGFGLRFDLQGRRGGLYYLKSRDIRWHQHIRCIKDAAQNPLDSHIWKKEDHVVIRVLYN
jgi:hypothetical protein